jgi:hypothetical protein
MVRRMMATLAVLTVSLAGLVGIVTAGTASASPGNPVGAFDGVSARFDGGWVVSGWATDGDTPGQSVEVRLYLGDSFVTSARTGDARPDVAGVVPGAGPSTGWHTSVSSFTLYVLGHGNPLCAYAINAGAGANVLLGCKGLPTSGASPYNPVGFVDAAVTSPNLLELRGWAADPDGDPTTLLRVYVDGEPTVQTTAALARPDVSDIGLSRTSGFDLVLPMLLGGHFVCVYAQNTGLAGLQNSTVGCVVTATPGSQITTGPHAPGPHDPVGQLDSISAQPDGSSARIAVTGWGYDPDTSAPATIRFLLVGGFVGAPPPDVTRVDVVTGVPRPDVQSAFPGAGANAGISVERLNHPGQPPLYLCAYIRDVGPGTSQSLGCGAWIQLLHGEAFTFHP